MPRATLQAIQALLGLLPSAFAALEFVKPPPLGTSRDISNNPVYEIGSVVELAWTVQENGSTLDLVLRQQNATPGEPYAYLEYIGRTYRDLSQNDLEF
jgi:hypothetical protein